jgi:hypothetical protein
LRSTALPEIAGLLLRLSASEPDLVVRGAARRLRQSMAFSNPAQTPVAPGSFALVAGCGSRVALRSTADIDLVVQLRVEGKEPFSHDYVISAGTPKPTDRLLSLPPGVVIASFGGREVARLSERNTPCPNGVTRQ